MSKKANSHFLHKRYQMRNLCTPFNHINIHTFPKDLDHAFNAKYMMRFNFSQQDFSPVILKYVVL